MSAPKDADRNQEATVYLGNLDEKCTDALIWELMLQAGPVANVHLPKDRISQAHQGFGFCEFMTEEDADYACQIMNQIKMWGKPIRVNKASYDKKQLDVGANLFVGSLDPAVDEQTLFDTFSAFGIVSQQAKISRDPTTGESKGYGFISYNDFESADSAIANMDGQFMMNKPITVQYAFKPDGKGERHGTAAERLLASQAKKHHVLPPGANLPTYDTGYQAQYGAAAPSQAAPPPGFAPPPPPPGMPVYGAPQPPMGYYPPQGYPAAPGYPPLPAGFAVPPPPPPLRMGFQPGQPPSA